MVYVTNQHDKDQTHKKLFFYGFYHENKIDFMYAKRTDCCHLTAIFTPNNCTNSHEQRVIIQSWLISLPCGQCQIIREPFHEHRGEAVYSNVFANPLIFLCKQEIAKVCELSWSLITLRWAANQYLCSICEWFSHLVSVLSMVHDLVNHLWRNYSNPHLRIWHHFAHFIPALFLIPIYLFLWRDGACYL